MQTLMAGAMWRWPDAQPVEAALGWEVDLAGTAQRVVPAGVLAVAREEGDPAPRRLRASVADLVRDLRGLTHDDADGAAHLAEHVRRYGAPDLCRHGLPRFHRWTPDEPRQAAWPRTSEEQVLGACARGPVLLADVVRFVLAADDWQEVYAAFRGRRAPDLHSESWEALVAAFPILEPSLHRLVTAEGKPTRARARQVADLWLSELLTASGVRPEVASRRHVGPGLVLASQTVTGLYAVELARLVGADAPEPTARACPGCGLEVMGPPDKVWCDAEPCRRERQRRRAAASRATRATRPRQ